MGIFRDDTTDAAQQTFEELCSIVESGIKNFRRVGTALKEIRDRELYKRTHPTFEQFCLTRWSMTDRHARHLIAAAELCEQLGDAGKHITSEYQARQVLKSQKTGTTVPVARRKRIRVPGGVVIVEGNKRFRGVAESLREALAKVEAEGLNRPAAA